MPTSNLEFKKKKKKKTFIGFLFIWRCWWRGHTHTTLRLLITFNMSSFHSLFYFLFSSFIDFILRRCGGHISLCVGGEAAQTEGSHKEQLLPPAAPHWGGPRLLLQHLTGAPSVQDGGDCLSDIVVTLAWRAFIRLSFQTWPAWHPKRRGRSLPARTHRRLSPSSTTRRRRT